MAVLREYQRNLKNNPFLFFKLMVGKKNKK